jgi:hypothetical protein
MFEDTKGIMKSCKSQKDRQYNDQKKTNKRTIMLIVGLVNPKYFDYTLV